MTNYNTLTDQQLTDGSRKHVAIYGRGGYNPYYQEQERRWDATDAIINAPSEIEMAKRNVATLKRINGNTDFAKAELAGAEAEVSRLLGNAS